MFAFVPVAIWLAVTNVASFGGGWELGHSHPTAPNPFSAVGDVIAGK